MSAKTEKKGAAKATGTSTRDAVEKAIRASKEHKFAPWDGSIVRRAMQISRWSEKEKRSA